MNLSALDLMWNDCGAHLIQILDEFGSGYANLNTVMQLPFSAIKRRKNKSQNKLNQKTHER